MIRDNVIFLLMPNMNPDGLEIVREWYERNLDTPFEQSRPPELLPPLRRSTTTIAISS